MGVAMVFDLGHHQVGLRVFDQRLELGRCRGGDGARVVGHLLAGGVVVAVHRNGFHAQALQRDQHLFAQFPLPSSMTLVAWETGGFRGWSWAGPSNGGWENSGQGAC